MRLHALVIVALGFVGTAWGQAGDQLQRDEARRDVFNSGNKVNAIYEDESHCLTAFEIPTDREMALSCWCRDALVDARYVYQTYIGTGKDRNLTGTYLALLDNAQNKCGTEYDFSRVLHATKNPVWRWDGPEVIRRYPSDDEIKALKPDSNGVRSVPYLVTLMRRDSTGKTTAETFTTVERIPDFVLDFKGPEQPKK